jgi:hypothetical protein
MPQDSSQLLIFQKNSCMDLHHQVDICSISVFWIEASSCFANFSISHVKSKLQLAIVVGLGKRILTGCFTGMSMAAATMCDPSNIAYALHG